MPLNKLSLRIFLIGFMGAGKSHVGKELAHCLQSPFIDLDEAIESVAGIPIYDYFEQKGEAAFRALENTVLQAQLATSQHYVMACGGGTPCFFDNMSLMKTMGKVIWLNPPQAVLTDRLIREKEKRPLLRSLDPTAIPAYVNETLKARTAFYAQAHFVIKDENPAIQTILNWIEHG